MGVELDKAENEEELLRLAMAYLKQLPRVERALVLQTGGEEDMEVVEAHGFDPQEVWSGAVTSRTLLRRVARQDKPVLLCDARQDGLYSSRMSVKQSELVSVLCVPLHNDDGQVTGLLYADSRLQVASFDYADLNNLIEFGVRLENRLRELKAGKARGAGRRTLKLKTLRPPSNPVGLLTGLLLLVIAGCWAVLGVRVTTGSPAGLVATPTAALQEAEPTAVADSFLAHLRLEDYYEAWKLLTPEARARLPHADFERRVREWLSSSTHRQALEDCTAVPGTYANTVVVAAGPGDRWTWTLEQTTAGWRLSSLSGGPVSL